MMRDDHGSTTRGSASRQASAPQRREHAGRVVAVFADAHAHADALEAVIAAATAHGVDELWSLGDMVGHGPDPEQVVARTRECCRVALLGNHDYLALRDDPATPSIALARARLDEDALAWMRSRKPAARLGDEVQCWHGGPHNAVHEFVGPRNAAACLAVQRAPLGLVAHTHVAAAYHDRTRKVRIRPDEPLDISQGKWLLNPGAVGAPAPSRLGWWAGMDVRAAALWLQLDLEARTATWRSAPFDPAPAHARALALGLVEPLEREPPGERALSRRAREARGQDGGMGR
jgi:predicted phosphodiesterase